MVRRHNRFDAVVPREHVPERARNLAERRVGGFVEEWEWQQTFSASLPGQYPRPTLLDIVVSAYLQGIDDVVETYARRGIEFSADPTPSRHDL